MGAVAGAVLTYVVKPLAITGGKLFVDGYFDPMTAKTLKGLLGEQEDLMPKLLQLEQAIKDVHVLAREAVWMNAWGHLNKSFTDLKALIDDLESKREKYRKALEDFRGKSSGRSRPKVTEVQVEAAAKAYYNSCRNFIEPKSATAEALRIVSGLNTTLPNTNKSLLGFSSMLLQREFTDVVTYAATMNRLFGHALVYLLAVERLFAEADGFCKAMQSADLVKTKHAKTDNAFDFSDPPVQKLFKNYEKLTGRANAMVERLAELAAGKTPVALRSSRWPATQAGYDLYVAGLADGTPHSERPAIGTGTWHARLGTEYRIGKTENRLHGGIPQIFMMPKANNKTYHIKEITDTVGKTEAGMLSFVHKTAAKVVPSKITFDEEDAANRRRLKGRRVSVVSAVDAGSFVSFGLLPNVTREVREFAFKHDKASQGWLVEPVEVDGVHYVRLRHQPSGLFLGGMRRERAYLTTNEVQSRWKLILSDRDSSFPGKKDTDKLQFILQSAHDARNALVCDFDYVLTNRKPDLSDARQRFQFIS